MDFYPWLVLAHVVSAFIFILAHGVSAFAMYRVRAESDRARLLTLLDLSASSLLTATLAVTVALVTGIVAAVAGGHFDRAWPWAAIAILVGVGLVMTPLAGIPMTNVRTALGQLTPRQVKKGETAPEPVSDADLAVVRAKLRPELVSGIGIVGLTVLVWLMQEKPF